MEFKSKDILETALSKGSYRNRSVCNQSDNSTPSVLLSENRLLGSGKRYISAKFKESKGVNISPLFPRG